ncbi:MAG: CDP-alcohol phosphatidyltransferase family protein [Dongiaceae bacterium]
MEIGNRRPIAARNWAVSEAAAAWLAARGATANGISLAGMAAALVAGAALATTAPWPTPWAWLAAALLVPFRLTCNMLDGMVAIRTRTASRRGELYNDVPDRIADSAVLIGLGYAEGGIPELGYAAAAAAILTAYLRTLGVSIGAPATFAGPMAKQQRMLAVILVAAAAGLWRLAGLAPPAPLGLPLAAIGLTVILAGSLATAVRRLIIVARAL